MNLLEGITRVAVEEPLSAANIQPDLALFGNEGGTPRHILEVTYSSPPSGRKQRWCRENWVDIFEFDARWPVLNHMVSLLWVKATVTRCWEPERKKMRDRLHYLMPLPDCGHDVLPAV